MADAEEETDSRTTESQDLWGSILSEVSRASSSNKTTKSVLVLGDDGSGKSSLVNRLKGFVDNFRELFCGLEYTYISVQDDDSDETASKLLVWTLDGDPTHKDLLRYAINANTIENALAMVVVDMSRPWTIMKTLEKWMTVLRSHIDELKIPPKQLKELEERSELSVCLSVCPYSLIIFV
jgi:dynein light intermediate chain 1